ncbi:MAG: response regulator [Candidatus Magasanikbacteria bacterium CG10_big_fil_rev_8_21_14_0_10_36_32]|uniref:Response regulator n=1 Tax=Candidatus Magasanikbacteria bacterium CG10_big_fil_rev_8_21_14_0_10_36_32 TaxID=1974646 RepID=A0A2M6W7B5_9BACT|nr:MAG: response regulator [Candidatus Magasanikbacteria bacterium CG10_big_fil_rev_8_21_14_0_10_36_32]
MFGKNKKIKNVLIVEDDALLSQVLGKAFSAAGFDVTGLTEGINVVSTTKKIKPAAILLDLVLPGLDGFTVLKNLKSDKATASIPVIVISNLGEAADIKSVMALGAVEYFIKANTQMEKIIKFTQKIIKD